ncbi:MAG: hypothetical protein Q8O41_01515 [Candidatus Methanoperedens sp.]|nr:hypothetical protein [Candidatus Methanoperedens sp.]
MAFLAPDMMKARDIYSSELKSLSHGWKSSQDIKYLLVKILKKNVSTAVAGTPSLGSAGQRSASAATQASAPATSVFAL